MDKKKLAHSIGQDFLHYSNFFWNSVPVSLLSDDKCASLGIILCRDDHAGVDE